MHPEVLDSEMLALSKKLGFLGSFSFYLAGGTGVALQLGHRKSFDFDFFTPVDFSPEELSIQIRKHHLALEGEMRRPGTLHGIIEKTKTSFMVYNTILCFPVLQFHDLHVADWRDIIVEKLRIVADRGQKKDFYDLYFGLMLLGTDALIELSVMKFGKSVNYFHLLKGMTYFDDAEKNPEPLLLDKSVTWSDVKQFFLAHIKDFENKFEKMG